MKPKCLHCLDDGWCNKFCVWCEAYAVSPMKCKGFVLKETPVPPEQTRLSDILPLSYVNSPLGGSGASLGGEPRV